jgi:phosphomethylpyrimidine synthase
MKEAAAAEGVSAEMIRAGIAAGNIIVCHNNRRSGGKPLAVGKGLRTKVNANIGSSSDDMDLEKELEKARVAVASGADALMDLSTGGPVDEIRRAIIAETQACIGSVPLYQAALDTVRKKGKAIVDMTVEDIFAGIKKHADDGVDFITVHCGVTRGTVARMKNEGRIMDVVSRGGAFTVEWMMHNDRENPQVMIEGPGHVPLNQIEANILLQKRLCHGAPFYVLGPLVTDIAPGYDHITCAIGGAIAAAAGADFLCYVTPSEHLRLPDVQDVRDGVIASRIAAHAADIAKGVEGAMAKDIRMAECRKKLDWEGQFSLALDPEKARRLKMESGTGDHGACTMCGEFCAYKVMDDAMEKRVEKG